MVKTGGSGEVAITALHHGQGLRRENGTSEEAFCREEAGGKPGGAGVSWVARDFGKKRDIWGRGVCGEKEFKFCGVGRCERLR